ncbi:uncharacterized protein DUF1839 [Roseibium hamelinense]|uniref:Uncharacterized protein DUF1839 n=1 Tax=Roseibium hamelinense TaxID=150831 RepID=A0A562T1E5_9HYPH|nr:DUF1839 family protein [Roseibium hamelinense]MTI43832.1 DUF1839 family protein [Roseibium hamelinense]TWI87083.1 uncharacterized protein DUF1839 [Roseibium hamelinense]
MATLSEAVFPNLDALTYSRHPLHSAERDWPETNCYLDVWIEVLPALGVPPEACLSYSVTQDFEGDQFTFFKVPLEDLETLYGLRVTELAIYDRVETHVSEQIKRGRLSLVEVDSFYLPDTHGVGYRQAHGKTTIAPNWIDLENRRMDYFHGLGLHRLAGDDFDGVFQRSMPADALPFLPYTEFVKLPKQQLVPSELLSRSLQTMQRHLRRRPAKNPVAAFADVFPEQVALVAERSFEFFHLYAFNTLRQLGANYELFGAYLTWLKANGIEGLENAESAAAQISTTCKTVQFQLARAVMRKKFDKLQPALAPAVESWDVLMQELDNRFGKLQEKAA